MALEDIPDDTALGAGGERERWVGVAGEGGGVGKGGCRGENEGIGHFEFGKGKNISMVKVVEVAMRTLCSSGRMFNSSHSNIASLPRMKRGLRRFGCLGCCEGEPQMFRMLSWLQGLEAGFRGSAPQYFSRQGLKLQVEACEQRAIPSICNLDFDDQPLACFDFILTASDDNNEAFHPTLPVFRRLQQIATYKSIRAIEERVSIWLALPPEAGTSHGARGGAVTMISSSPNQKYYTARHLSHLQPSCGQQEDPSHNGKSCLCN